MTIPQNILKIINSIPPYVTVIAATKSRSISEIKEAINTGITIIGENYVQEAKEKYAELKGLVSFHLIGHLQSNKVKIAVEIFDMIQTIDSLQICKEINKRTKKIMPVLVEINTGYESNKTGILPDDTLGFLNAIRNFKNMQVKGIMAMAPSMKTKEEYRHYFRRMKDLFNKLKHANIPNISMEILSMGMSDSYTVAIEEGSTMVRIGRDIFGYG